MPSEPCLAKSCLAVSVPSLVDAVGVGLARPLVGDVEPPAVGRADDAVRADHVADDANHLLAVRRQIVDVLAVLLHAFATAVARVGEVDAALGVDPQVVGTVEPLAFVLVRQHGDFALGRDGYEPAVATLAGQQVAVLVEVQPIGPAGILQERAELAVRDGPLENAVVGNIPEVDVALGVRRRPLGELEIPGQLLDLSSGRDHGCGFLGAGLPSSPR